MKKRIKTASIGLMCCAGGVFANSTNLSFIFGSAFSSFSNVQYMSPVTGLTNLYAENSAVKTRFFYGFGAEYDFDHITVQPITLGLGVSLYDLSTYNIAGIETPGVNILPYPQDTLNYTIKTKNLTVLFEPKLIYTAFHLQPYVLGGLGYARNTLSNFSEYTSPGSLAAPSTSLYPNHTTTVFAYEVGSGLQYAFWNHSNSHAIIFHVEYRYLNLGQSRLGRASEQTTNQNIHVNNTSNIVDIGITYRI